MQRNGLIMTDVCITEQMRTCQLFVIQHNFQHLSRIPVTEKENWTLCDFSKFYHEMWKRKDGKYMNPKIGLAITVAS